MSSTHKVRIRKCLCWDETQRLHARVCWVFTTCLCEVSHLWPHPFRYVKAVNVCRWEKKKHISDTWREGNECPSLMLLLITSHLPFPPPFILPPSHPHHSALLLSILCSATLLVLAVPPIKSPWLWCHCPFLSCRCGLICPLSLALSLSHSGLDKSPSLLPPVVLLSSISISSLPSVFPSFCLLLRPFHIWINIHVRSPGDSTNSSTPLTSLLRAADWRWCWFAACSCRAAKADGVRGERSQSTQPEWTVRLKGLGKEDCETTRIIRVQEERSQWQSRARGSKMMTSHGKLRREKGSLAEYESQMKGRLP